MRRLFLVLATLCLVGCHEDPIQVIVDNQCVDSWVSIRDGSGDVRVARLEYGSVPVHVGLDRYGSGNVLLHISARRLSNNAPMGAASESFYVSVNNGVTQPTQYYSWIVMGLNTTDPNGGCRFQRH